MLKPILANPIGRRFIATSMFATAVLSASSLNLAARNSQIQSSQTELIDYETAKALHSRAININSQEVFKHNKKLDKIYLKNCEPEKTIKDKKETLRAIYTVYGTLGGSIEIQKEIDNHFAKQAIDSYLEHFSLNSKSRKHASEIITTFYKWQNDVFYTDLYKSELEMYEEQSFPTAEKFNEVLDNHMKNPKFFSKDDFKLYQKGCEYFKSNQKDKTSVEAQADLLAYKTHVINVLGFYNFLTKENDIPEKHLLNYYFDEYFLNGEGLIKP